jgi:effector-binding domain-containing protein
MHPPEIADIPAQLTAVIRLTIPRDQIRAVMGPAMREVMEAVHQKGIAPSGPMFSHHFRMHPGIFDFEVGVPVPCAMSPVGRVIPGELPAVRIVRTVYHGPYERLADAWEEFDAWIFANGHSPLPDLWERYISGPESHPEPSHPSTELARPLRD